MVKLENVNKDNVLITDELLTVDDLLEVKIYIGNTTEHFVKVGKVIKVYDKNKYNMLLCQIESKTKVHYYTCVNQIKGTRAIFY